MNLNIQTKLDNLPDKPGVYIMKDNENNIIYIGKAVSLKRRVKQYFRSSGHTGKVGAMVSNINDFEYILTDSEVEALILESNLIKKNKPKYNILLKDDKNYPFIEITLEEEYPRIMMARKIKNNKNKYYGPYTSSKAVRDTIEVIKKIFPIRTCNRKLEEDKANGRPCLNYYIKQCWGPCLGNVKKSEYNEMIEDVCRFLDGKEEDILKELKSKMEECSKSLQFEQAAVLRDRIRAVEQILERQKIVSTSMEDQDIIALASEVDITAVQAFFVRKGKLISVKHFILDNTQDMEEGEIINSFIKQFYNETSFIPKRILIQAEISEKDVIEKWLSKVKGSKVYIHHPQRGEKRRLVEMAERNAQEALKTYNQRADREKARTVGAVEELKGYLNLDKAPRRMECYDISNTQGVESVGSMAVFQDGKADKKDYRRFKIKTVEGPDDYASIAEVISRRFKRGLEERKQLKSEGKDYSSGKFSNFPDLVVIDGGKGQLNVAINSMARFGVGYIPTVGLAEKLEEIYTVHSKESIVLPRDSNALYLMQRIRDEAHRFALTYHRSLRDKKSVRSVLLDVPGIGSKRMKALIKAFGSLENIRESSLDELIKVEGMTEKAAENILEYFNG